MTILFTLAAIPLALMGICIIMMVLRGVLYGLDRAISWLRWRISLSTQTSESERMRALVRYMHGEKEFKAMEEAGWKF